MDIKKIILKSIYGQLSEEEQLLLDEWKTQQGNDLLYNHIRTTITEKNAVEYLTAIDVERALEKVKNSSKKPTTHTSVVRYYSIIRRIAAVVVLLIVGGAFWFHHEYTRVIPPVITDEVQQAMQQSIESGKHGAEVVSSALTGKELITRDEAALYHVDDRFADQLSAAKRITTYHDKEYWVTLSDGTLVHLNYNSRLIYPEKFGDRRDVILDGEAYFMVAHDKHRKFVVHTPQGDIKVYGTEFWVKTPHEGNNNLDETDLSVVLVQGSVSFTPTNGNETQMYPGQQLSLNVLNPSTITLRVVETEPYQIWNTGRFTFNDYTLGRLMNILSLWYNVSVDYEDKDLQDILISGSLSKYEEMEPTLETLEAVAGIEIAINKNHLYIKKQINP